MSEMKSSAFSMKGGLSSATKPGCDLYTRFLRYRYKKKPKGFRSGKLGGKILKVLKKKKFHTSNVDAANRLE